MQNNVPNVGPEISSIFFSWFGIQRTWSFFLINLFCNQERGRERKRAEKEKKIGAKKQSPESLIAFQTVLATVEFIIRNNKCQ